MIQTLILAGDINLQGVTAPEAIFAKIAPAIRSADVVFGNLECCFYEAPGHEPGLREGFYAPPIAAEALSLAGFDVVGTANNVTFGDEAILASLARLDALGIAHTGAGRNLDEARKPALLTKGETTFAFVQRTSVYWPRSQEATKARAGVAVLQGHTAYRLHEHCVNRPGVSPAVVTWTDAEQLAMYSNQLRALKRDVDVLVASHHWGLGAEVLDYQVEIAHAAIDAGADIVFGHGPHEPLEIELYQGKPIFYGAGCFSFDRGHKGRHESWIGYFAAVKLQGKAIQDVSVHLVRRTASNETVLRKPDEERQTVANIVGRSAARGTRLVVAPDRLDVLQARS